MTFYTESSRWCVIQCITIISGCWFLKKDPNPTLIPSIEIHPITWYYNLLWFKVIPLYFKANMQTFNKIFWSSFLTPAKCTLTTTKAHELISHIFCSFKLESVDPSPMTQSYMCILLYLWKIISLEFCFRNKLHQLLRRFYVPVGNA